MVLTPEAETAFALIKEKIANASLLFHIPLKLRPGLPLTHLTI